MGAHGEYENSSELESLSHAEQNSNIDVGSAARSVGERS